MQASGPVKGGGKAFGTRDRVVECLLAQGDIRDSSGMASPKLAEAVGYPGSSIAFAQLLSGMERAGLIAREVRGKRTYRVHLTAAGRERARLLRAAGPAPDRGSGRGVPARPGWQRRPAGAAATTAAAFSRHGTAPAGSVTAGSGPDTGSPDYDELAHRLLVQVARRLLASRPEAGEPAAGPASGPATVTPAGPDGRGAAAASGGDLGVLEDKVATLETELARAKAARSALQAENEDLRDQLARIRDNLDRVEARLAPRHHRPASDRLNQNEIALLQRLLAGAPADEGGSQASTA